MLLGSETRHVGTPKGYEPRLRNVASCLFGSNFTKTKTIAGCSSAENRFFVKKRLGTFLIFMSTLSGPIFMKMADMAPAAPLYKPGTVLLTMILKIYK